MVEISDENAKKIAKLLREQHIVKWDVLASLIDPPSLTNKIHGIISYYMHSGAPVDIAVSEITKLILSRIDSLTVVEHDFIVKKDLTRLFE